MRGAFQRLLSPVAAVPPGTGWQSFCHPVAARDDGTAPGDGCFIS